MGKFKVVCSCSVGAPFQAPTSINANRRKFNLKKGTKKK